MSDDKKAIDETSQPGPAASAEGGEVGVEQLKAMIAALQADLEKKSAEIAAKQDQYLRAVAETENVRRRLEKEKEDIGKYAITKFAKDILSVGDNFQRAIAAVPKDAVETDPALKSLLDGVTLAERDYKSALERHGVRIIDPTGKPFDPHHHQAVMEQENTSVPAGTVLQVYQVGYMIDDRNLRPAMVVVSRGGPKPAKTDDTASATAKEPPQADA
ncbi:MAG: nucleotide exchange factor GrpE [Hyphomicrobium sp.]|uniref:nucleotide exchange factor GrpE n=1 Tax=Hyphomicrobium sp. TaxID=82 RepID=UPI0039E26DBD